MATLKFLISYSLLLVLASCFLKKGNALEDRKASIQDLNHYHNVEISSLLPASVCNSSKTKGPSKRHSSTLEVVHRYGPCSQLGQEKATTTPSLSEVLSYDQSRVDSIQARLVSNSNMDNISDQKVNLPAQSGLGGYIVTVGLGTPTKSLSLAFDTGSDLTWTQCQPCIRSCYQQQDPIFNPSASGSYTNVSCNSPQCSQLPIAGLNRDCASGTCVYGIQYGDQSFSIGFFSEDKLTLTSTDVFPNFLFGCGQNNQGLFGNAAGLLGLGQASISIVSQTSQKYGKYFSYCLPSTSTSTGHLTFGKNGVANQVKFTPFDSSQGTSYYFIDILSISVGGQQLPIRPSIFKSAGNIIDSGTVITRLPPAAYAALRTAFKRKMTNYPTAPAYSLFDTCYDLSKYTSVTIPTISFTFGGNVKVDLDPSGILVAVARSRVCLAFARNKDASNVGIFGSTQQQTLEVVYDVAGGMLGFGTAGCN